MSGLLVVVSINVLLVLLLVVCLVPFVSQDIYMSSIACAAGSVATEGTQLRKTSRKNMIGHLRKLGINSERKPISPHSGEFKKARNRITNNKKDN